MSESGQDTAIVKQLARYLRENPLACDTLDGIARWWLVDDDAPSGTLAVALAKLERCGIVVESLAADGQVRYRRAALTAMVDARLDRLIMDER